MSLKLPGLLLLAILCLTHFAEAQVASQNCFSIGIASSLIVSGEQNATYDIVHAAQVDYSHAIGKKISLLPQLGYALSPYNKNFRLTAFQALVGIEYTFKKVIHSFSVHTGYEYSQESFAFKFDESVVRGTISNPAIVLKGTVSFTLIENLRIQTFIEVVPNLRTSVGLRLAYFISKNKK